MAANLWIAGVILFNLDNLVGTPTMARTTTMAWMAGLGRMYTDTSTRRVTLQISLPVSRFFLLISHTDISACRARVKTVTHHRTRMMLHRRIFSRVAHSCSSNAHALAHVCPFQSASLSKATPSSHLPSHSLGLASQSCSLSYFAGDGIRRKLRRSTERFMVWPCG